MKYRVTYQTNDGPAHFDVEALCKEEAMSWFKLATVGSLAAVYVGDGQDPVVEELKS